MYRIPGESACALFDTTDYATYLSRHGCAFGRLTCCDVNKTMLEEYSTTCGVDVCDYKIDSTLTVVFYMFTGAMFLIILGLHYRNEYSRAVRVDETTPLVEK